MSDEAINYLPHPVDIRWLKDMLSLVSQDGVIVYPATRLFYRVDRRLHTLTLVNPKQLSVPDSQRVHQRTIAVAHVLGWQVEVEESN